MKKNKSKKNRTFHQTGLNALGFSTGYSKSSFGGANEMIDDPTIAANRIGPFSFEVDPMIETEVLTEAVVKEDLAELDEILPQ